MVSLQFRGSDEMVAAMLKLPQAVRRQTLVQVLKDAAEPMRAGMAAEAPRSDRPPHIADNIVATSLRSYDGLALADGEAAVGIGPARGFNYGLLLELGFKAPRPFVRRVYDELRASALNAIGSGMWQALLKR